MYDSMYSVYTLGHYNANSGETSKVGDFRVQPLLSLKTKSIKEWADETTSLCSATQSITLAAESSPNQTSPTSPWSVKLSSSLL